MAYNAANFVRTLAEALRFVGRGADSAHLVEAYLDIARQFYSDKRMISQTIAVRLATVPADSAVVLVSCLVRSLDAMGRMADAAMVLDAWGDGLEWLEASAPAPLAKNAAELLDLWFAFLGKTDERRALHVKDRVSQYLAREMSRPELTPEARERLGQHIQTLRMRLVLRIV